MADDTEQHVCGKCGEMFESVEKMQRHAEEVHDKLNEG
jgi:hypothetical protein